MKGPRALLAAALLALVAVTGCDGDETSATKPAPAEPTREASGRYCGMILVDHSGPKAQVHLPDEPEPVWFSSVRDAIAFTMLPEEPRTIVAMYVNDMGVAQWDAGMTDVLLDIGEARALGHHPDGRPWRVGLRRAAQPETVARTGHLPTVPSPPRPGSRAPSSRAAATTTCSTPRPAHRRSRARRSR